MQKKCEYAEGAPSTAAILGHPIHPALIPFPIALLISALVTDIVYWFTTNTMWANFSFWLLIGGVATALLAAVAGAIDFFTIGRARERARGWVHAGGNLVAVLVAG